LFQLAQPLGGADLKTYQRALSKLQGNILTSHGRDFAQHVFLTFKGQPDQARDFLSKFADRVTSATAQQDQTARKNQTSELFASVSLSAEGYKYLGFDVTSFSKEFQAGMKNAALADPPSTGWEDKFQRPIHAMVILAHDSREELNRQMESRSELVRGFADVSSELGIAIHHNHNRRDYVIEHFGYRDGLSQPIFYKKAVPAEHEQWDPSAGPNLVLVKDPLVESNDACGTYFVFRKLEQNVKEFQMRAEALAVSLKLPEKDAESAGAMIIGRFTDGTPVVKYKEPKARAENDFQYQKFDPAGNRCPFFAHIRKANPRNGDADRARRIARRGITYGEPIASSDPSTLPATGVGLLFQCCQADLHEQFEFLQHSWADNNDFPTKGTGKDPVIGESADGFPPLEFPCTWDKPERTQFDLPSLVTMKGGEYFFVPSISFLKGLK
jgi:Dyp-type peroxidase family